MAEDSKKFKLKIYSPTRIFFEEDVDFVEFVTTEGEIGVYRNHIPMTVIVAPGVLRLTQDGTVREASLVEGFATILQDEVVVLSEACEWPEEIDYRRAEEARIRAERRLSTGGNNYARAELALRRALVRMQLSEKYR